MSTATESRQAERRIPGEAGLWAFILLDLVVFTVFFVTVLHYRGEAPAAFAAGQAELHGGLAVINTLFLVTGSLVVVRAVEAARSGAVLAARRCLTAAIATGCGFLAVKGLEYAFLLSEGYSIHDGTFYLCYFAFTGVHLVHVVVATAVLLFMRRALRAGSSPAPRLPLLEGGAAYWHMVDLLWLILFPLLYLSA
ncbi:cytochrome c oxidase subunit 3 [Paraconexibacter sp.]|uniref:cytochrome c oxidase subunit 3 n=1 Tax=Paraconexibacter sp. TaxID=2949640 RepID=UPI00356B5C34